MTTTGERLVSLSTLPSGTALAHFLALSSGGVIVSDGLEVAVGFDFFDVSHEQLMLDVELEPLTVDVEVGGEIAVELAEPAHEIEVEPS